MFLRVSKSWCHCLSLIFFRTGSSWDGCLLKLLWASMIFSRMVWSIMFLRVGVIVFTRSEFSVCVEGVLGMWWLCVFSACEIKHFASTLCHSSLHHAKSHEGHEEGQEGGSTSAQGHEGHEVNSWRPGTISKVAEKANEGRWSDSVIFSLFFSEQVLREMDVC